MGLFNWRKKKDEFLVKDVYVLTAHIVSSSYVEGEPSPRDITVYYLGIEKDGYYYEIFSGEHLELEADKSSEGFRCLDFDTPYVKTIEPLSDYLVKDDMQTVSKSLLFKFITKKNIIEYTSEK